jgi:tetratricopeptide (TPR) repeat protein
MRRLLGAVALLLLAGCAPRAGLVGADWPIALPKRIELSATPFIAQDRYQCGPAALATVLRAANAPIDPQSLVSEVYVPGRRGSLQSELLAATRRRDLIPYVIAPSSAAMAAEVAAGRPVLVLLNLGLDAWPRWHYAVVIGYDAARGHWILRSGRTERATMSARRFAGAWHRAERWAVAVYAPGASPGGMDPQRWIAAVAPFESLANPALALRGYDSAVQRWPHAAIAHFARANALAALGRRRDAEGALEQTLAIDGGNVPARSNLAELLAQRGCIARARHEIDVALRAAAGTSFESAVQATAATIRAREAAPDDCPN